MVRNGEINLQDARRILRRFWWILPVTVGTCLTVAVIALRVLPKRFTSQTIVLVDPPTIAADVIRPVVPESLGPRLASMQQQILSRTRLEPVIQKFGLYHQGPDQRPVDDLVTRLRSSIEVAPIEPMAGTSRQLPGFLVKVTLDDPLHAQQICSEITSMFMAENSRARVEQGQQATNFLTGQLDEAKAKLDAQDANLAQFKMRHSNDLPDREQANLGLLVTANSQLDANAQALSRAQQDKAFTETLLAQQEANWQATKSGQNPATVNQQLGVMEEQLAAMRSRYTEEHPDVVKLKALVEDLKRQAAAQPQAKPKSEPNALAAANEPPQLQQLRAKLHQDTLNIVDLNRRQQQIQDQIRVLQGRVQSSPLVEQEYKGLVRNYQTALDFYNGLLKSREQAEISKNLEQKQEGEQFRVLDPPNLPNAPSFPKKPVFLGGGAAAGLALGLGILFLIAMSDKSLHTERDVETYLKLPVLALVPLFDPNAPDGPSGQQRPRKRENLDVVGTRA